MGQSQPTGRSGGGRGRGRGIMPAGASNENVTPEVDREGTIPEIILWTPLTRALQIHNSLMAKTKEEKEKANAVAFAAGLPVAPPVVVPSAALALGTITKSLAVNGPPPQPPPVATTVVGTPQDGSSLGRGRGGPKNRAIKVLGAKVTTGAEYSNNNSLSEGVAASAAAAAVAASASGTSGGSWGSLQVNSSFFENDSEPKEADEGSNVELAARLFDQYDFDVNAHAAGGYTALHYACEQNDVPLCDLLLRKHACLEAHDNRGWSPLRLAYENQLPDMMKFLRDSGASPNDRDHNGMSVIHVAVENVIKGGKSAGTLCCMLFEGHRVKVMNIASGTPLQPNTSPPSFLSGGGKLSLSDYDLRSNSTLGSSATHFGPARIIEGNMSVLHSACKVNDSAMTLDHVLRHLYFNMSITTAVPPTTPNGLPQSYRSTCLTVVGAAVTKRVRIRCCDGEERTFLTMPEEVLARVQSRRRTAAAAAEATDDITKKKKKQSQYVDTQLHLDDKGGRGTEIKKIKSVGTQPAPRSSIPVITSSLIGNLNSSSSFAGGRGECGVLLCPCPTPHNPITLNGHIASSSLASTTTTTTTGSSTSSAPLLPSSASPGIGGGGLRYCSECVGKDDVLFSDVMTVDTYRTPLAEATATANATRNNVGVELLLTLRSYLMLHNEMLL